MGCSPASTAGQMWMKTSLFHLLFFPSARCPWAPYSPAQLSPAFNTPWTPTQPFPSGIKWETGGNECLLGASYVQGTGLGP